jgi:hypothetical protein
MFKVTLHLTSGRFVSRLIFADNATAALTSAMRRHGGYANVVSYAVEDQCVQIHLVKDKVLQSIEVNREYQKFVI